MSKETSMVMIASSSSFNRVKEEYIKEKTRFMYKVIILTGKTPQKRYGLYLVSNILAGAIAGYDTTTTTSQRSPEMYLMRKKDHTRRKRKATTAVSLVRPSNSSNLYLSFVDSNLNTNPLFNFV